MIRTLRSFMLWAIAILMVGWIALALWGTTWFQSRGVWIALNPPGYDYEKDAELAFKRFGLSITSRKSILGFNTGYSPWLYTFLNALQGPPYKRERKIRGVRLTAQVFRIEATGPKIESFQKGIERYCQQASPDMECEIRKTIPYDSIEVHFWGIGYGYSHRGFCLANGGCTDGQSNNFAQGASTKGSGSYIHIKSRDGKYPTWSFWISPEKGLALLRLTYDNREFGRTYNYLSSRTSEWLKSRQSSPGE